MVDDDISFICASSFFFLLCLLCVKDHLPLSCVRHLVVLVSILSLFFSVCYHKA